MEARAQTKRELLLEILEQGMAMVQVDARHDDTQVPSHLVGDPDLRLNLSYRFQGGLAVEEAEVRSTLSFGGQPFPCVLPLDRIYMMFSQVSGEGFFFPGSAPLDAWDGAEGALSQLGELKDEVIHLSPEAFLAGQAEAAEEAEAAPARPAFRVVEGGLGAADEGEAEAKPSPRALSQGSEARAEGPEEGADSSGPALSGDERPPRAGAPFLRLVE